MEPPQGARQDPFLASLDTNLTEVERGSIFEDCGDDIVGILRRQTLEFKFQSVLLGCKSQALVLSIGM